MAFEQLAHSVRPSALLSGKLALLWWVFGFFQAQAQSNYATPYTFTTLAGSAGVAGAQDEWGSRVTFNQPQGIAVDKTGNSFVVDTNNYVVREVTPDGHTFVVAGRSGMGGFGDGPVTTATFGAPEGIAIDTLGNIYVTDELTVRKISNGTVQTLAGGSVFGNTDGTGTAATFNHPFAIAVDSKGNLYVSDTFNETIRMVTPAGKVTTLAGSPQQFGSTDGTGSAARFNLPKGIAVDNAGNVYVADSANFTIRKITPSGVVTTFAGMAGVSGSTDGAGSSARFDYPMGLAIDASGNLYVSEYSNCLIRKIAPDGSVTTLAGRVAQGSTNGTGSAVLFGGPSALAVDSQHNLYVADTANDTIRLGTPGPRTPQTVFFTAIDDQVFGYAPINLNATCSSDDPVVFQVVSGPAIAEGSALFLTGTGLVTVAAEQGGTVTYNDGLATQSFNVSPAGTNGVKGSTVVNLSGLSQTYDGTSKPITVTSNPTPLNVVVTYNGSTVPPTNAGSYSVVATVNDPLYQGGATGTLIINQRIASVTLGALTAAYDGTAHVATVVTSPVNLAVSLTYNGSPTAPTAVGSYAVKATVTDPNCTGTALGTLVITKGTATITLGNLLDTYTALGQAATAITSPVGLPVTFTYNGSTRLPVAVGSYAVVAKVNTANATGTVDGTLTISPATAAVTLGGLNRIYTGKATAATATTTPARLAVTFTYNGSPTPPTLVGSYVVVATIHNANYTGTANGTLVIGPILPLATTSSATAATNGATLNAMINPKGDATSVVFKYGLTTTYDHVTTSQNVAAGTASVAVAQTISGLAPQTLYHYRAVATNEAGTVNGLDKTFTTLAAPLFIPNATAYLSAAGAQLAQTVNPNGVATQIYFEYGTSSNIYTGQTPLQSIGAGKANVIVYALLSGLNANTTYYYRLVTVSAGGTFPSPTESTFTTLGFVMALVQEKGDAATEVANATYTTFGNPIINSHDAVAFAATLTGAGVTTSTALGIFAEDNSGTPHLVAQSGRAAPGTDNATFASFSDPVSNNNAAVAFAGQLKVVTNQATKTTASGIWSTSSGSLQLAARQGSVASGTNGGSFGSFTSLTLSDSAGVVFAATLNPSVTPSITTANNVGIWEGNTTGDLHLLLRTGDTVGGKTITKLAFLSPETYVGGQTRNFNTASGDIICGATFSDNTTGVVAVIGGTQEIGLQTGDPAAGIVGATYASFGNAAINTNNRLAYAATLALGPGGVTASNNRGIWGLNSSMGLLVARSGTGLAPGTTATFAAFSDPVYNNNYALAFRATLNVSPAQATTATGIWGTAANTGSLSLVAQQGVTQAPGCPAGATFSGFLELALADQGGADNQSGVMMLATLNTNSAVGVTSTNNLGIWAVDSTGTLQLIARTGDTLDVNGNAKTITALSFLPHLAIVNGQSRSFAQASGDLVYLATYSDNSIAIFNVQFP